MRARAATRAGPSASPDGGADGHSENHYMDVATTTLLGTTKTADSTKHECSPETRARVPARAGSGRQQDAGAGNAGLQVDQELVKVEACKNGKQRQFSHTRSV